MRIGVFDSGLGGLTVVQAMRGVIKGAELFYVADTKHAPYGEKTTEQILQYSILITEYLRKNYHIEALIVACNTATSAAIKSLREIYPELIIIGTEPGIKPAIAHTHTGKIGVLATPATLEGEKYQQLARTLCQEREVTIYEQACPGLVQQIEKGAIETPQTEMMLRKWLDPMREKGVDTIVLGCTHYPLVSGVIENIMGNVTLIETGGAIAKHLLAQAEKKGHHNEGDLTIHIETTGEIVTSMIDRLIPQHAGVKKIDLDPSSC